jgi:uncharacterized protein
MAEPIPLRKRRPCPICKRKSTSEFHPFCSKRCADEDLSKWLGGNYAIPGATSLGTGSSNEDD